MSGPFDFEAIAHVIVFLIVLFIATVFWVSYYRVRSFKLLLAAVAFTLLITKPILHRGFGIDGPYLLLLDIIVFSFIALSFLRRSRDEDGFENDDEIDTGDEPGGENDCGTSDDGIEDIHEPEEEREPMRGRHPENED